MKLDQEMRRPDGLVNCRNCAHDPGHARLCHLEGRHATGSWKRCGHYEPADEAALAERRRTRKRPTLRELRRDRVREICRRRRDLPAGAPFIRLVVDNTRKRTQGPEDWPPRAA